MILSAGFGTRLRPLTDELAKPLMPVGDRPILAHVVEVLARGGVRDVVVNTHHRASDFDRWSGRLGSNLQVVHEARILGTAGGLAHASAALGPSDVVVWNGDILAPDLDVAALVERRRQTGVDVLWVVERGAEGTGTVGLDDRGNVVRLRGRRFGVEASGGNFLGVQAVSAELRAGLPPEGCLVADVALPLLERGGTIASFAFDGAWDDVGTPAALLQANLRWLDRQGLAAYAAPDAQVEAGVRLERTIVGSGAVVRGSGRVYESVVFPGAEITAPEERALVAPRARVTLV